MTDQTHPSFRTKTGFCTVTPEHIVLTRQGFRGELAKVVIGSSMRWLLLRYAVIGFSFFAIGAYFLVRHEIINAVFPLVMGIFFLLNVVRSRNYTATPVIPRAQIQTITAIAPMPPAKRGYFIVAYLEESRPVKRLIILPGVLENGQAEFQKALTDFQSCGLLVT